jgi:hypothetical protein
MNNVHLTNWLYLFKDGIYVYTTYFLVVYPEASIWACAMMASAALTDLHSK